MDYETPIPPTRVCIPIMDIMDSSKVHEIYKWCENSFGACHGQWDYDLMWDEWQFKNPQDATLFRLRWS